MAAPTDEVALELVRRSHEAALDPSLWPRFLDELAAATGGSPAVVLHTPTVDEAAAGQGLVFVHDLGPEFERAYLEYYQALDPWLPHLASYEPCEIVAGDAVLDPDEARHTEFYNDFLRPQGVICGSNFAAPLEKEGGRTVALLSMWRRRGQPELGAEGVRLLERLAPHVRQARRVSRALAERDAALGALSAALDALPVAVIVLDARGRVREASRAARGILAQRAALVQARGELRAATLEATRRLREALQRALAVARREGGHGWTPSGVVRLPRPDGGVPLAATAAPLPARPEREGPFPSGPGALLLLADPSREVPSARDALRALFGLTPAEAELATHLANERSLREAAERMGNTEQTARWRLKQVLAKTGARSQAVLVRRVVAALGALPEPPR